MVAMQNILIVYATTDGHTRKICDRMHERLRSTGSEVRLVDIADAGSHDPARFARIVVGGSVRYGKHDARLLEFMRRHAALLQERHCSFFSVNLVARKPEKRTIEGNNYVRKFLEALPFRPEQVEIIAGKLDYPRYGFIDRLMIRLIMKMTGGPTDPKAVVDYTDWDEVDRFADSLAAVPEENEPAVAATG
jgi:menaquinone-dependent protoporphyrinogen oxidase